MINHKMVKWFNGKMEKQLICNMIKQYSGETGNVEMYNGKMGKL